MKDNLHIFRSGNNLAILDTYSLKKYYIKESDKESFIDSISEGKATLLSNQPTQGTISNIQIATTTHCNMNCIYCQLKKNRLPKAEDMSLTMAKTIIGKYNNIFKDGTVILTGGESLLNWDVTKLFIEKSSGRKIIFTNGTLLDKEKILFFKQHNVFVILSSDGTQKCNDFSRFKKNKSSAFGEIERGLLSLKEYNLQFGISLVLNEGNYKELSAVCEWLINKYAPSSIGVNLPHYTIDYQWNFPEKHLIEEFRKLFLLSVKYNIFIDPIARYLSPLVKEEFKFHDCSSCGKKVVIYPNGDESNCILKFLFAGGNSLHIWEKRTTLNSEECKSCYAKGVCGGGCIFDGNMFFGEGAFDKRRCPIVKKLVESIVWNIYEKTKALSPTKKELNNIYSNLINNPNNKTWSIGHD